jgi:release factor glutamine methyltransferase
LYCGCSGKESFSPGALVTAKSNAELNGVKVDFREGSLFDPVLGERFDLIVSNPPYIPTADIDTLQPEVRAFEPLEALDGGLDGLDFYRRITSQAPQHLNPGGWLMFELGIHQAEAVRGLLWAAGFSCIFTSNDLANIERVVGGRR